MKIHVASSFMDIIGDSLDLKGKQKCECQFLKYTWIFALASEQDDMNAQYPQYTDDYSICVWIGESLCTHSKLCDSTQPMSCSFHHCQNLHGVILNKQGHRQDKACVP